MVSCEPSRPRDRCPSRWPSSIIPPRVRPNTARVELHATPPAAPPTSRTTRFSLIALAAGLFFPALACGVASGAPTLAFSPNPRAGNPSSTPWLQASHIVVVLSRYFLRSSSLECRSSAGLFRRPRELKLEHLHRLVAGGSACGPSRTASWVDLRIISREISPLSRPPSAAPPRCCCSAPFSPYSSPCQRSPFFVIPVPLALSRDAPDRPARVPHAQLALGRLHPRHGRLRRAIRTHPSLAALSPSWLAGAIFSLPLVRQVPRGQHPGRPGQRVARRRARGGRARRQRRRQQRPAGGSSGRAGSAGSAQRARTRA